MMAKWLKGATWNRQLVKNTRQGVGAQKIPVVPPLTPAGLGSSLNFGLGEAWMSDEPWLDQ
jgi:hypothetical protein